MKILAVALSEFKPVGGVRLVREYRTAGAHKNCDSITLSDCGLWLTVKGAMEDDSRLLMISLSNISFMSVENPEHNKKLENKEIETPTQPVKPAKKVSENGSSKKPTRARKTKAG